jgi:hypothetical protein
VRTVPPKKPKNHRGVPELNSLYADDLPDRFTLEWQPSPVYDYKVIEPDDFDKLLDDILVLRDDPLPPWAVGVGWHNAAGPDRITVSRKRWSGEKTADDYRCQYRHKKGDSEHNEPSHDVESTLDEMVFVESGEPMHPGRHWVARYKPWS